MTSSNVTIPSSPGSTRENFAINNAEDYRGGNRCGDISSYKQDVTSLVTHSDCFECCYYSEC